MTKINTGGWLASARQHLGGVSERPQSEAAALLARVVDRPRDWIIAHPEYPLTGEQAAELDELLRRRLQGEPLPYLVERWGFYGMEFTISPAVLIPRPETELLVETGLKWLEEHSGRRAADVGTGSGCIAASLAANCADLHVAAVDRSRAALMVARENFYRHNLQERVFACQSDLLAALSGPFNLVCANLPYIPSAKLDNLAVSRYEPRQALDGGRDGLDQISRLLEDAPRWMADDGLILLEIEAGQGESAPRLAEHFLPGARTAVLPDLAGNPRLLMIEV